MVLCAIQKWFSHDPLPQGEICPYCKFTAPTTTPTTTTTPVATASSVVSAPTATATSMTIPAARYSNNPISAVSKSRALVIARARAPLSVPDKIRLAVKVAHAVTDSANVNTNTNPTYRQFVEGFKCGIIPGKMFSVASLTAHLLADARAIQVPTDNWNEAVFPPSDGKWGLAVNELTRARPGPQIVKT